MFITANSLLHIFAILIYLRLDILHLLLLLGLHHSAVSHSGNCALFIKSEVCNYGDQTRTAVTNHILKDAVTTALEDRYKTKLHVQAIHTAVQMWALSLFEGTWGIFDFD